MKTFPSPNVNVAAHSRAGVALNGAFRRGLLCALTGGAT